MNTPSVLTVIFLSLAAGFCIYRKKASKPTPRVEYLKLDDHHVLALTFHPGIKEPFRTIATLLPRRKNW